MGNSTLLRNFFYWYCIWVTRSEPLLNWEAAGEKLSRGGSVVEPSGICAATRRMADTSPTPLWLQSVSKSLWETAAGQLDAQHEAW